MNSDPLYSIRMRATCSGRHVSGSERLVPRARIREVLTDHIRRASGRTVIPDHIVITMNRVPAAQIIRLPALSITTMGISGPEDSRAAARFMLLGQGISQRSVDRAFHDLEQGGASGGHAMRGAMLVDARTGERRERDRERGVRASRFDWDDAIRELVHAAFQKADLTHFRTQEAVALATKVAHAPGILAEFCLSDEPDYTAGYVASRMLGYVRFPELKAMGDPRGGRVFFVDPDQFDLDRLYCYLEQTPVLIRSVGEFRTSAFVAALSEHSFDARDPFHV